MDGEDGTSRGTFCRFVVLGGVVDEFIVTEGVAPYRLYVSVFCFR